jgi:hypothetical protein
MVHAAFVSEGLALLSPERTWVRAAMPVELVSRSPESRARCSASARDATFAAHRSTLALSETAPHDTEVATREHSAPGAGTAEGAGGQGVLGVDLVSGAQSFLSCPSEAAP